MTRAERSANPMGPWVERAACRGLNATLFHPERGESADQAKAVCATCPVRTECLDYAMATDQQFGLWGGLSERGRGQRRPVGGPGGLCAACGDWFPSRRHGQRFCSVGCRDSHRTTWSRL